MSVVRRKGFRDRKQKGTWNDFHEKIIQYFKNIGAGDVRVVDIQNDFEKMYGKSISRDTIYRHLKVLINEKKIERRNNIYFWIIEHDKKMFKEVFNLLKRKNCLILRSEEEGVTRYYFPGGKEFVAFDSRLWGSIKNELMRISTSSTRESDKILICFLIERDKVQD